MENDAAVSTETADTTQADVTATTEESTAVAEALAETTTEEVAEVPAEETAAEEVTEDGTAETDEVEETEDETAAEEGEESATFTDITAANKRIKELQKENTRRRLQNKDTDAAFEGADEDFRAGWLELGRMLSGSEEEQNEAVAALSRYIGGAEGQGDVADAVAEDAPAVSEDSIIEKVGAIFEQRERDLAVKAQQAAIALEVQELGYTPDADAATNPEAYAAHALLWQFVASQPEGQKDLAAAHAAVQDFEKSVLNRKLAEMKNSNTGLPQPNSSVSSATSTSDDSEPVSAKDRLKKAEEESIRFYAERNSAPRF